MARSCRCRRKALPACVRASRDSWRRAIGAARKRSRWPATARCAATRASGLRGRRCLLMDCPPELSIAPLPEGRCLAAQARVQCAASPCIRCRRGASPCWRISATTPSPVSWLVARMKPRSITRHRSADRTATAGRRRPIAPACRSSTTIGRSRVCSACWTGTGRRFTVPPASETVRREFESAWCAVLPKMRIVPDSIALFDYHTDNLLRLDRPGIAACGLIDFPGCSAGARGLRPCDLAGERPARHTPMGCATR